MSSSGPSDAPESGFTLGSPAVQMAFACESISTDFAGRISFTNLVDELNTASFPATTAQLFIIFGFIGQLPSFLLKPRVVIEDSLQAVVAELTLKDMALTADTPVARAISGFQGIQWPRAGRYVVKFIANGNKVLATFPLNLVQIQASPSPAGGPPGT